MKSFIIILFLLMGFAGNSQSIKCDFSHIEIILDSASFEKMAANDFIRTKLAPFTYDTMMLSPLVLSYYIYGQNNFIHFNPARGYFGTQLGTAYLIFQTSRPGQGKILEESFRKVAKDSIVSYDFEGPDFTLTEIVYNHHDRISKKQHNNLIPMLSSYSVETYKKWGHGDSAEITMEQFLSKEFVKGKKLFESIVEIELAVTQKDLEDIAPVLKLAGYHKKNHSFTKNNEPTISYVINNKHNAFKVKKMTLQLSEDAGTNQFNFGKMNLLIKNNIAEFCFD